MTLGSAQELNQAPAASGDSSMAEVAQPGSADAKPAEVDDRAAREVPLPELLAEDIATYQGRLTEPGLWAVVAHRLGTHAERARTPSKLALGAAHRVLSAAVQTVWGIDLPKSVQLGRRVRIWHFGCMQLHAKSIGNDVHIRHDTTLGPLMLRTADPSELPTIGDRVDIGVGVCVMGDVRVGEDSVIGANSLVTKTVPPSSTVLGVPARILPK